MERQQSDHSLISMPGAPPEAPPRGAAPGALGEAEALRASVAAAAAEAAREAVDAAFAELRPALLRAIAQFAPESKRKQHISGRQSPGAPSGRRSPAPSIPMSGWRSEPPTRGPIFEDMPARPHHSEATPDEASAAPSVFSVLASPVATMYSLGRFTIHSLQADSKGPSLCSSRISTPPHRSMPGSRPGSKPGSRRGSRHQSPARQLSSDSVGAACSREATSRELDAALCQALSKIVDEDERFKQKAPRRRRRSAPSPDPGQWAPVFEDMPSLAPASDARPSLRRALTTPHQMPGVFEEMPSIVPQPAQPERTDFYGAAAAEGALITRASTTPLADAAARLSCAGMEECRHSDEAAIGAPERRHSDEVRGASKKSLPNQILDWSASDDLTEGSLKSCSHGCPSHTSSRHLRSASFQSHIDDVSEEPTHISEETRATRPSSAHDAGPPCTALYVVGLLRWETAGLPGWLCAAYQWQARACVFLAAVALSMDGFSGPCEDGLCWRPAHLPLVSGALLALVPLRLRQQQLRLAQTLRLLQAVTVRQRQKRRDAAVFTVVWLACVAASVSLGGDVAWAAGRVCLVAVSSAAVLSLAHSVVHVCRPLAVLVDAFSREDLGSKPLDKVARDWNVAQSVLRQASADMEQALLALGAALLIALPALLPNLAAPSWRLLPSLLAACGVARALFVAAALSERCGRVPATVNAAQFGAGTNRQRQDTVDYIASSAPGLYVLDSRLTTSAVVKAVYLWCLAAGSVAAMFAASAS